MGLVTLRLPINMHFILTLDESDYEKKFACLLFNALAALNIDPQAKLQRQAMPLGKTSPGRLHRGQEPLSVLKSRVS